MGLRDSLWDSDIKYFSQLEAECSAEAGSNIQMEAFTEPKAVGSF